MTGDEWIENGHETSFADAATGLCPVCLSEGLHCQTSCGHGFHIECLKQWVRKGNNCPLCRSVRYDPISIFCVKCHAITGRKNLNRVTDEDVRQKVTCKQCQF